MMKHSIRKKYLMATPRWYSYGGMFISLFEILHLARYYNRKIILTYSDVHWDLRYNYPALLNRELIYFKCDEVEVAAGYNSWISKVLTLWLNISHRVINTFFGKVLLKLKIQDKIAPIRIGYSGLENAEKVQRLLNLPEPVNWQEVFRNPIQVDLAEEQEEKAKPILEKLGIKNKESFVCLYVRDPGFDKLKKGACGSKLANADIEHFKKAVLSIIGKGYHVIRVGDPRMSPIEIHEKFIDYVHTPYYSELMDLYFYRHCSFWVGTMSGGRDAPLFYNRPCVVVNAVELPYSGVCINKDDAHIRKHIFSVRDKRFISLKEQLERLDELPPAKYDYGKYLHVENTPDEINQVVLEWYEGGRNPDFDWNLPLQEEFYNLKKKRIKEIYINSGLIKSFAEVGRYQHLQPRMGKRFLENCWEYGPYLEQLTEQYKQEPARMA